MPRRQNLAPSAWGRTVWNALYVFAVGFPENPTIEEQEAAMNMVLSLQHLLPCESCRNNFLGELRELPVEQYVGSRKDFIKFVNGLHQSVSTRLGKPTETVHEATQFLRNGKSRVATETKEGPPKCNMAAWSVVTLMSVIIAIVVTWALCKPKK